MGGANVTYEVPQLPNKPLYSNRLDVYDLFWQSDFSTLTYKAFIPETNSYISGQLDEHGRTKKMTTADPSKIEVLVGLNDDWGLNVQGYDVEDLIEHNNN
jgi:type VI secretion system secreted protein VgrG